MSSPRQACIDAAAGAIRRHEELILNWFKAKKAFSSGVVEGLNLRAEVLKGMDEKVRQGWPTGHAPFGYLNVDDKNEPVIPHPENSKAVMRLFELYSTGKHTFKSIAWVSR